MSGQFDHTESEAETQSRHPVEGVDTQADKQRAEFQRKQVILGLVFVGLLAAGYFLAMLLR